MSGLEIPNRAWDAATEAQEIGGSATDAIQVVAPIIVAAELRRLANENDPVARVARVWLSERANEIDPPVVGA